jgi:ferrous iron transport protein B
VGNFPGVTVEKKSGVFKLNSKEEVVVVDLPGTYSLYPRRSDEWVSYKQLMSPSEGEKIDVAIVVVDATALRRNLLYVSQVIDLKIPVVVALTMTDIAKKRGIKVNVAQLSREMQVPIVSVNARSGKGVEDLKTTLSQVLGNGVNAKDFFSINSIADEPIKEARLLLPSLSDYALVHHLINHESFDLPADTQAQIENIERKFDFNHNKIQAEDIQQRYKRIGEIIKRTVEEDSIESKKMFSEKLDSFFLHRTWGSLIMAWYCFFCFKVCFWLLSIR